MQELTLLARQYDIGINIDAEESERLDISLDLLEALCATPGLEGWNGIGFVVQAYGKRAPFVLDYIIDLAKRTNRRIMVRLVKGAYWDSEIKKAQVEGMADYPVYTRKCHTDISYIACARKLLNARDVIFPQFAPTTPAPLPPFTHWQGKNTRSGLTSSNACTAWANRSTVRLSGQTNSTAPHAFTRRLARMRHCWPIWSAACWKTGQTPPLSTRSGIAPLPFPP